MKSKCCNAFTGKSVDGGGNCWFECSKCGLVCDPVEDVPQTYLRNDESAEGTRESLQRCINMLEEFAPELFPPNKDGQVHFARAIMETVSDEIRAFLLKDLRGDEFESHAGKEEKLLRGWK